MQLTKTQKRHGKHGMAGLEKLIPTQRETVPYPERRDGMVAGGELPTKRDESAQRLKTPTGSVKPACSLQELQGSQTGNCWV